MFRQEHRLRRHHLFRVLVQPDTHGRVPRLPRPEGPELRQIHRDNDNSRLNINHNLNTPQHANNTPRARVHQLLRRGRRSPGHADLQPDDQDNFSQEFSAIRSDMDDDTIGPDDPAITRSYTDGHGVNYDFSCSWVPGWVTSVDKQSFGFPLGSPSQTTAFVVG